MATMTVSRLGKNKLTYLILEVESGVDTITLQYLKKESGYIRSFTFPILTNNL